jgi:hypothetical protein
MFVTCYVFLNTILKLTPEPDSIDGKNKKNTIDDVLIYYYAYV